jgi:4-hydroxy-2-oxoheptanedioate aldolase
MGLNNLKNKLSAGQTAIGIWTNSGSPFMTELIGLAEPDYVVIDAQHGFLGSDTARLCLLALARMTATPLVRVPSGDEAFIGQMLDAGAQGVIVPMIESAEQARRAVAACRMAPSGRRSFGPVRASQTFGRDPEVLSSEVLCIVLIETADGVANVEEIVAVEGVYGVCIGQADLAISYGLVPGPEFIPGVHEDGIERVRQACVNRGLAVGMPCTSGDVARDLIGRGFDLVSVGFDTQWVRAEARSHLDKARLNSKDIQHPTTDAGDAADRR